MVLLRCLEKINEAFFSYMIIVIHRGSELTLDNPVIQKL